MKRTFCQANPNQTKDDWNVEKEMEKEIVEAEQEANQLLIDCRGNLDDAVAIMISMYKEKKEAGLLPQSAPIPDVGEACDADNQETILDAYQAAKL